MYSRLQIKVQHNKFSSCCVVSVMIVSFIKRTMFFLPLNPPGILALVLDLDGED